MSTVYKWIRYSYPTSPRAVALGWPEVHSVVTGTGSGLVTGEHGDYPTEKQAREKLAELNHPIHPTQEGNHAGV